MSVSSHGQDELFDSHTESVQSEIVVSWLVCDRCLSEVFRVRETADR
jgi:hypothetical protein